MLSHLKLSENKNGAGAGWILDWSTGEFGWLGWCMITMPEN
jgi:hypothetical protein